MLLFFIFMRIVRRTHSRSFGIKTVRFLRGAYVANHV